MVDSIRTAAADVMQQARAARDLAVQQRDALRDDTEVLLKAADALLFALGDPELDELPVLRVADLADAARAARNTLYATPARGELPHAGD